MQVNRVWLLLVGLALGPSALRAQDPAAEVFVREAVRRAAAGADARLALQRDDAALARARATRGPTLTLSAQHVELSGGADIGALVNPAFAAINQLTGRNDLPTNLSFTFPLRQDARARLSLPLFDDAIGAGVAAARAAREAQDATVRATDRDLDAAVRLGLLQHAAAAEQVRVRAAVLVALEEQLRVSERRAAEGLTTPDVVLRARADRSEAAQRLLEAEQQRNAARRALNRLARRPLDADIPLVSDSSFAPVLPASLDEALVRVASRDEIARADAGVARARAGQRIARSGSLPTVSLAADAGWQGDRWEFTADNDVRQLTLVASWTPFQSGRDGHRRREAQLERERAQLARDAVAEQLALEIHDAWDAWTTARSALAPAADRAAAAVRSWELVRRSYAEGIASPLDLTSARAAATAAEVDAVLARYAAAAAAIRLARATALTPPASSEQVP